MTKDNQPSTTTDVAGDAAVKEDVFAGLSGPYSTIVADPPWRATVGKPGAVGRRGDARKHYSTMSIADLCRMDVACLAADNSHLWLWAINSLMNDAYSVVQAWGFRPTTVLTWCKPGPGVGYYLRNNTEHCIFATRGKPMVPESAPLSSWFVWPRGAHSAKPAAFLDVVESVSPGPYVELFAREPRLGWDSWGHGYEVVA